MGAAGVAEAYGVAAAIDLLPGVGEAAVFVLKIAAGGAVELDELVLVDRLAVADAGGGWAVIGYADGCVGVAAFAEAVGYC